MRRTLPLLLGLLLLPLSASAGSGGLLYDQMKTIVEQELSLPAFDPEVTAYIRAIFRKQLLSEDLPPDEVERRVPKESDISAILRDEWTDVCGRLEGHEGPANRLDCLAIVEKVRRLAADEMRVRKLGRLLQAEASGYELPISDLPGRSALVATDLRGILNIWGAGAGAAATSLSGTMVRVTSLAPRIANNPSLYQQLFDDIGYALTLLDREEWVAAVWRYQYGVRLVNSDRAPRFPAPHPYTFFDSGPGTERQYLFKRWDEDPDLEGALMAVWQNIAAAVNDPQVFSPPLRSGETALLVFPEELQNRLPANVLLWARIDGNSAEGHPMGDIGLQWHVPLEPVLPSLVSEEEPIVGGRYPPEPVFLSSPVDGDGLCTSPAGMRGYLCRPIDSPDATERCPVPADLPPDAIALTFCEEEEEDRRFTMAGADVCREIFYRTPDTPPPAVDPQRSCKISLACAPGCSVSAGGIGSVSPKDAAGTLSICLTADPAGTPPAYGLTRALVHAQYLCALPPGTPLYRTAPAGAAPEEVWRIADANAAFCCEAEGTGYRAMCDLMERDGVFAGGGDVPGFFLTAESCAEMLTERTCRARDPERGCYLSRSYPLPLMEALEAVMRTNPAGETLSCAEAITHPRVTGTVAAIEGSIDVCSPESVSRYDSRIGSHLCFIGQCVEQSLETHRVMPGRTPSVVGDSVAPWDDPLTGTPLGALLMQPPLTLTRFPSYRPELLLRTMETALCQAQGMPPRTPPILCALLPERRLGFEQGTGWEMAWGLLQQTKEQQETDTDLLSLSPALGARAGTALYARYLEESSRSFALLLHTAADLLADMTTIRFPTQMCPIGPGLPDPTR